MKPSNSPGIKKALAYKKDHRIVAEYPHAFRRIWPRKKAWANRKYRHRADQRLAQSLRHGPDEQADSSVMPVRRDKHTKSGVMPLVAWVRHTLQNRDYRVRRTTLDAIQ